MSEFHVQLGEFGPDGPPLNWGTAVGILGLSHYDCHMKNDLARHDSRPEELRAINAVGDTFAKGALER